MNRRFGYDDFADYSAPRLSVQAKFAALLSAMVATLRLWVGRRHDRRAMLRLDDHMLRDIGLDRFAAERMAARPFWRA